MVMVLPEGGELEAAEIPMIEEALKEGFIVQDDGTFAARRARWEAAVTQQV